MEDEITKLRQEVETLREERKHHEEELEKLKRKVEKERAQHAVELQSANSLKDTLQTTLVQVQVKIRQVAHLNVRTCIKERYRRCSIKKNL
jgi:hypothetical protein